jgi:hypothetical protein
MKVQIPVSAVMHLFVGEYLIMAGNFPAPWGVPSQGVWYPDTPLLAAGCFIQPVSTAV